MQPNPPVPPPTPTPSGQLDFISQVLSSKREWKAKSRIITPVYITLVSGMLLYMVGWTIRTAIQERKEFEVINAISTIITGDHS